MAPSELRARRRALGLTQAGLGAALGVAGNTVARWERGTTPIGNPALVQLGLELLEGNVRAKPGLREARLGSARGPLRGVAVSVRGTASRSGARPGNMHNLLVERTSLVGREQEVAAIRTALLGTEGRLVTLTGAGGAGKTRLAVRVGSDLVESFPDGVWLVELASLTDPARVPEAAASALGIREHPGRPLLDTLVTSLSSRQMLVVLDNCEHLANAGAALAEALLRGCPRLRLLATSREPLHLSGEVAWRVPPLTIPDAQRTSAVDELSTCTAVRLFVDRARSVRPDFMLTVHNADAVAQICTLLAGLPLALELAAARVRVLGVKQIQERLGESLPLLTDDTRGTPARHRTLEVTLDWSHALLSEPERAIFHRLSVFAGSWTLEAAEAVCENQQVKHADVLDILTRLVDKSLVVMEEEQGQARYWLLEPIRQYAQRCLLATGEAAAMSRRHAAYFLSLAERLEADSTGLHARAVDYQQQAELANFRVALGWIVESGESELGLRLAAALRKFWIRRGSLSEGREWFSRVLRLPGSTGRTPARAMALCSAGVAAYYQGDHAAASALVGESVAIWRELSDLPGLADALDEQGLVGWARANLAAARTDLAESLQLAQALGLQAVEARSLYHLGLVTYEQGDYAAAQEWHAHSLAVARNLGDNLSQARALYGLGQVAHRRGHLAQARSLHERGLAKRREVGENWGMALALVGLGQVSLDDGDLARAGALFAESLSLSRELGDRHGLARSLEGLAACAAAHAQPEAAFHLAGAAAALREAGSAALSPTESALLESRLAAARRLLGDHRGADLMIEARGWVLDEAIALALSIADFSSADTSQPATSLTGGEGPLTRREYEVAALVAHGLNNGQIATQLVITRRTVAAHIEHILGKLGFSSRTQVGVWASERHLHTPATA